MNVIGQILNVAFRLLEMSVKLGFMVLSAVIKLAVEGISALMASRSTAPEPIRRPKQRRRQWQKKRR